MNIQIEDLPNERLESLTFQEFFGPRVCNSCANDLTDRDFLYCETCLNAEKAKKSVSQRRLA